MTYSVAVLGTGAWMREPLRRNGFTDLTVLRGVTERSFDTVDQTWTLRTGDGAVHHARIVVDEDPPEHSPPPYLGVAVHGTPNYFLVTGPDRAGQAGYIADCLRAMQRCGSTRIEVRHSTQRVYNDRARYGSAVPWRRLARKIPASFHLSSHPTVDDEVFDGPVEVRAGDEQRTVRARLSGHLDPIDGRYHWQGTVFDDLPGQIVTLSSDGHSAEARVTERSPWGTCSVRGVGVPPFPLDDVEVTLPG